MLGNRIEGPAFAVFQEQRLPLEFRQQGQRLGQAQRLLLAHRLLTGRRLIGDRPGFQARRRFLQGRFQGTLAGQVALGSAVIAHQIRQRARQDLPQPGGQLRRLPAAELIEGLMRFQQGLLDHVGGIAFAAQTGIQLHLGKQMQIVPEALQGQAVLFGPARHDSPL